MEWVVTDTNETIVATIQTANSIISTICGLPLYGFILYRILRKKSTLSQYQELIVLQSSIGAISILFRFLANERVTITGEAKKFFDFMPYPTTIQVIILFSISISRCFEEFFIIIFIFIGFLSFSGLTGFKSSTQQYAPLGMMLPTQLEQRKDDASGVIHCVLVVSIALSIPLIFVVAAITNNNELIVVLFSTFYGLLIVLISQWYSTAIGALMLWSIRGLLKKKDDEASGVKSRVSKIAQHTPRCSFQAKSRQI